MPDIYIADDEPIIIRGLKKMLSALSLDVQIAGCSTDGNTALSEILSLNPDIVISDIAMPGKTGLELLYSIKESHLETKVIFLSGYAEFAYVKEALSNGAVDYLLKPIEPEELERAIQKTISQLEDQKHLNFLHESHDELQKIFKKLNTGSYEVDMLYENFKEQGFDLEGKVYVCVQFYLSPSVRRKLQEESYEKYTLLKFSIFNQISEYLEKEKLGFPVKKEDHTCTEILILPKENSYSCLEHHIVGINQTLQHQYQVFLTIGVGELFEDIREWQISYKTTRLATGIYYFTGQQINFSRSIHREFSHSFEEYYSACQVIYHKLLRADDSVIKDFEDCLNLIENLHFGNRTAAVNRCISLMEGLLKNLASMNMIQLSQWNLEQIINLLNCQETYAQLKTQYLIIFKRLFQNVQNYAQSKESNEILEIKEYIKKHYCEDLSLNKIAAVACMNPSYFSTFFKKSTGQNFKTYLTGLRMEKALCLLLQTDMKIYEISDAVGYKSVRQFTDVFKQEYGVSPMDYKKSES